MDVPQAKTALPNRVNVLFQFRVSGRLSVRDAAIRPEFITDLKCGTPMLVARRCDLTDCSRFQFRDVTADGTFGLAQSLCQFAIRRFEATALPVRLQADESKQTKRAIR